MKQLNILIYISESVYQSNKQALLSLLEIISEDTRIKVSILTEKNKTIQVDDVEIFTIEQLREEKFAVINNVEKAIKYLKVTKKPDILIWMGGLDGLDSVTVFPPSRTIPFMTKDDAVPLIDYPFTFTDSIQQLQKWGREAGFAEKVIYLPLMKVSIQSEHPTFVNRRGIAEFIDGPTLHATKLNEILQEIKLDLPTFDWKFAGGESKYYSLDPQKDIGVILSEASLDEFLQYAKEGKPVILPFNDMYKTLLGENYPLFIQNLDDLQAVLLQVLTNEEIYRTAAKHCFELARKCGHEENKQILMNSLWSFNEAEQTILIAGHDFKFLYPFILACARAGKKVLIDQWLGHKRHNRKKSMKLLAQADVIFCEWGLGNTVFYPNHVKKGQKLFIRVHRQELETSYMKKLDYNKVANVITISPYMMEEFHHVLGVPRRKIKIIPNMLDTKKFNLPKKDDANFNLGIIGIVPKLKRVDRAVEIFERLWQEDKRYKLHIKGKLPQDLPWLKNRKEDMEFFDRVFEKINQAEWKENVIFSPFGPDISEWLTDIGIILSTSDLEAFHLAPMEGMASGATPIVFNWDGADLIYPEELIVTSVDEAVEKIKKLTSGEMEKKDYRHIYERYDVETITNELMELVFE